SVADNLAVDLGKDRTGAGDLQLLAKKPRAPWVSETVPFDRHDLVQVGGGNGPKGNAIARRKKITDAGFILWLVDYVSSQLAAALDGWWWKTLSLHEEYF